MQNVWAFHTAKAYYVSCILCLDVQLKFISRSSASTLVRSRRRQLASVPARIYANNSVYDGRIKMLQHYNTALIVLPKTGIAKQLQHRTDSTTKRKHGLKRCFARGQCRQLTKFKWDRAKGTVWHLVKKRNVNTVFGHQNRVRFFTGTSGDRGTCSLPPSPPSPLDRHCSYKSTRYLPW